MKIKLPFPPAGIEAIKSLGLRQINPETLRWTTDHPASHYGTGVLLRGKSGEILDGKSFAAMHHAFGAWIECDSANTKRRCENALVTAATELDDAIKIAEARHP
jgi:urocanate hydratase